MNGLAARSDTLCAKTGQLSLAQERPLRALLPQVLHPIHNKTMPMQQLDGNLLFRWLVSLNMAAPLAVIASLLWQLLGLS